MRHRLASQIRRPSDICLFCALRCTPEIQAAQGASRLSRRAYTSSLTKRAATGTAAAQKDDEEEEFPLLKQNAVRGGWPTSNPISRSAPLPPLRPPPEPRQAQRQPSHSNNSRTPTPATRHEFPPRRDARINSRLSQEQGQDRDGFQQDRFSIRGRRNAPQDMRPGSGGQPDSQDRPAATGYGQQAPERNTFQRRKRDNIAAPNTDQGDNSGGLRIRRLQSHLDDPDTGKGFRNPRNDMHDQGQRQERGFQNRQPRSEQTERSVRATEPTSTKQNPTEFRVFKPSSAPESSRGVAPQHRATGRRDGSDLQDDTRAGTSQRSMFTGDETAAERQARDQAEEEERVQHAKQSRLRGSGRFELEEEVEAELPIQTYSRPESAGRSTSRRRSQDFDFDLFDAEQASGKGKRGKKKEKKKVVVDQKPTLSIPEFMTVQQLAQAMKIKVDDLVRKLEEEGFEGARYDHMLDAETSAMFADIYGFEPVAGGEEMQDLMSRPLPEDISSLPPRPPIVTIMGHVDHGKTTILDWLRKSSVAAGEAGGITQHIGAFSFKMPGSDRQITFLDTPGHEAFLDMRRRGANVTDIVVLVVAADDSVKPQTIEAIKHALQARVQLIVAINKVDKYDANIEQVKQDLTRHDIVVEDYGGDYQAIPVSGKTGQGMAELEEAITTLSDVLDLRAEQDGPAEGQIIEAKVTNAGRVATVLVRRGVLRVGDFIVAGPTWGRVRTLRNDANQLVQEAFPGDPVQVDGWRGDDPTAGLEVLQAENEQHAKDVVELRHERAQLSQTASEVAALNTARTQEAEARAKVLAWESENKVNSRRQRDNEGWVEAQAASGAKLVPFVIKADVAGSVEAIVGAVSAIGNHEVQAKVIHSGTGQVTESDIRLLATTGEAGFAISFNQPVNEAVQSLAYEAGLQVLDYNIIYRVTEAVKEKVIEALPPLITQKVLGEAEVGKVFDITVKKEKLKIAGCKITKGTISRSNKIRVIRNGDTIYTGTLHSLKNVKKDVTEMRNGTECGMGFDNWQDMEEGDLVQCFEDKEEKRTLY